MKKLMILLLALFSFSTLASAQEAKREAPSHRIVPYKDAYHCNGTWKKVMTRRNRNGLSTKHVGYRCVRGKKEIRSK